VGLRTSTKTVGTESKNKLTNNDNSNQHSLLWWSILFSKVRGCGGPGSVAGIATAYGLDGPGIESRWGRDFPHQSRPALRSIQLPVQWVPDFPGGKVRPRRDADPSLLLVPRSKIKWSYSCTLPKGLCGL